MNKKTETKEEAPEATFVAIKQVEVPFETNNFVEVSLKKCFVNEAGEDEAKTFVAISRGFFASGDDRQKRYKRSITVPSNKELVEKIISALQEIIKVM